MQYIRKFLQRNLLFDDKSNSNPDYKPEWQPEIFIIKNMKIITDNHNYFFDEAFVDVIIESSNYFTIVDKNLKNVSCIRFEDVTHFEFELSPNPNQTHVDPQTD